MKIENYTEKFEEEVANGKNLFSDPHIICGYKMRLIVCLNGYDIGKGTHMSVYIQLMRGVLDDVLKWPFDRQVDFVLIHQDNQRKYFKCSLFEAKQNKDNALEFFQKPVSDSNTQRGCAKYITLEKLHADGFIKNDKLYIQCLITQ